MMNEPTVSEHRILGIDPGTTIMGYALLATRLNHSEVEVISIIRMKKFPDQYAKLKYIYEKVNTLIEQYHPDILSIESPFYSKNVQAMMKLARAQGVVIAACLHAGMTVYEYTPLKIKQSITGRGNATKKQVAAMLAAMYPLREHIAYLDATDALAAAVCHHLQNKIALGSQKFSNWKTFISQNEDRILK